MKILLISSYYNKGGAARATLRLSEALIETGIEVSYQSIYPKSLTIYQKFKYLARVAFDRLPAFVKARKKIMFSSGGLSNTSLVTSINNSDADVVHLHWINAGAIAISDLAKIKKPLVLTFHDMWGFTGGCHYTANCDRYKIGCGSCPALKEATSNDLSSRVYLEKKKTLENINNITVVGVSQWLKKCIEDSNILQHQNITSLPNPINTNFFFPTSKRLEREKLGLSLDKKFILYGAMSATDDARKGYPQLIKALSFVSKQIDFELLIFGGTAPKDGSDPLYNSTYFGHINDDVMLRSLYNAADVMLVPSLQEAFGQTATESMACGTPVVAFGATGLLDIVDHKINGYLAAPFDSKSLAEGIEWVLSTPLYANLQKQSREKVVRCFDNEVVAKQYITLYEKSMLYRNS